MTTGPAPICGGCSRFREPKGDQQGLTCDAFPDGIPQPILRNQADHRLPIDGDHGLRFVATSPEFADYADTVLRSLSGESSR